MASKLLLLPLVPALAFGIVEVASRISMPTSAPAPISQHVPTSQPNVVVIERVAPAPLVKHVAPPQPPPPCIDCTATA